MWSVLSREQFRLMTSVGIYMCAIQVSTSSAKLMNSEVIDYIPSVW